MFPTLSSSLRYSMYPIELRNFSKASEIDENLIISFLKISTLFTKDSKDDVIFLKIYFHQ